MSDLAMQVGRLNHVAVDDANGSDSGTGDVLRGRAAEAPSPNDKHAGVDQAKLPWDTSASSICPMLRRRKSTLSAHARDNHLARVSVKFVVREAPVEPASPIWHGVDGGERTVDWRVVARVLFHDFRGQCGRDGSRRVSDSGLYQPAEGIYSTTSHISGGSFDFRLRRGLAVPRILMRRTSSRCVDANRVVQSQNVRDSKVAGRSAQGNEPCGAGSLTVNLNYNLTEVVAL